MSLAQRRELVDRRHRHLSKLGFTQNLEKI